MKKKNDQEVKFTVAKDLKFHIIRFPENDLELERYLQNLDDAIACGFYDEEDIAEFKREKIEILRKYQEK